MISVTELKDLISRKISLINSFDAAKKTQVYDLRDKVLLLIKRYSKLEKQVDDDKNPPSDLSLALTVLKDLERDINSGETELRSFLSESEPLNFSRDPSDAGTIAGNGAVIFRTNGSSFFVPAGTLTQEEIEDIISKGNISTLTSKP